MTEERLTRGCEDAVDDALDDAAMIMTDGNHAAHLSSDVAALRAMKPAHDATSAACNEDATVEPIARAVAATAGVSEADRVLSVAVDVALSAYRAEGRTA